MIVTVSRPPATIRVGVARFRHGCAVLAGAALLLGCDGIFREPDAALPVANLDVEPKPGFIEPAGMPGVKGPMIQVASGEVSGEEFRLTLYRSADGFCLSLAAIQYRGGGCGAAPGEGPEFGLFGVIGQSGLADGTIEIDGMVAPDVASVWVVTDDGRRANALLVPAELDGLEASVFVVFLPADTHPTNIVAADGSGAVLEEFPILSIAPGGEGAPPRQATDPRRVAAEWSRRSAGCMRTPAASSMLPQWPDPLDTQASSLP